MILAYENDQNDITRPVASIKCDTLYDTEKKIGEIGMMGARKEVTGKGVGRLLIAACEKKAKDEGCESVMLEILEPSEWQHPVKLILHNWYSQRLGYKPGEALDFAKDYP